MRHYVDGYPDLFSEGYIVESTIEAVVKSRQFRIEAIRSLHTTHERLDVRYYEMSENTWKSVSFGWCDRDNATDALMQALGFIWEALREH